MNGTMTNTSSGSRSRSHLPINIIAACQQVFQQLRSRFVENFRPLGEMHEHFIETLRYVWKQFSQINYAMAEKKRYVISCK